MQEEPVLTQEEKHNIWMKNSGYLYDRLSLHDLKWPSLTFQWLPTYFQTPEATILEFIIATHTSGKRQDEFVQVMQVI